MCPEEGNLSVWHATAVNKDNHKTDATTYTNTLPTPLAIRDVQISNTPHSESGLLSFGHGWCSGLRMRGGVRWGKIHSEQRGRSEVGALEFGEFHLVPAQVVDQWLHVGEHTLGVRLPPHDHHVLHLQQGHAVGTFPKERRWKDGEMEKGRGGEMAKERDEQSDGKDKIWHSLHKHRSHNSFFYPPNLTRQEGDTTKYLFQTYPAIW